MKYRQLAAEYVRKATRQIRARRTRGSEMAYFELPGYIVPSNSGNFSTTAS
jgi:hypothetical protein